MKLFLKITCPIAIARGAISALFRCQPLVAQFGYFRVVRNGDSFGTFVTYFAKKWASGVRVCGTLEPQAMMHSWSYTSPADSARRFVRQCHR